MQGRDPLPSRERAVDMPAVLVAFIVALLGIEAARAWLEPAFDLRLVLDGGFIPARLSLLLGTLSPDDLLNGRSTADAPGAELESIIAGYVSAGEQFPAPFLLTYAFLHGSWTHVVLNCVWLAAFGAPVVRRCGSIPAILLAAATAVGAALGYWIVDPASTQVVIGASGIASGFMGAASTFVFGPAGPMAGRRRIDRSALQGPTAFLRNRNALVFLAVWFAVNLAVGVLGRPLGLAEGGIAWQAHIGGLLTGIVVFPLLDRLSRGRRPPIGA